MITYNFKLGEDSSILFELDLLGDSSLESPDMHIPGWMLLENFRCSCCTIPPGSRRACPAALAIEPVVDAFKGHLSYEKVDVEVLREDIKITAQVTAQEAVRSIAGLLMGLSSCPIMTKLRPMAYFHQPFGSSDHTVFRVLGMFLTAQYMRKKEGLIPDWNLKTLVSLYDHIHEVNQNLARRLREASLKDAAVNSLVILDAFGYAVQCEIEDNLLQLKPLFKMYFEEDDFFPDQFYCE